MRDDFNAIDIRIYAFTKLLMLFSYVFIQWLWCNCLAIIVNRIFKDYSKHKHICYAFLIRIVMHLLMNIYNIQDEWHIRIMHLHQLYIYICSGECESNMHVFICLYIMGCFYMCIMSIWIYVFLLPYNILLYVNFWNLWD